MANPDAGRAARKRGRPPVRDDDNDVPETPSEAAVDAEVENDDRQTYKRMVAAKVGKRNKGKKYNRRVPVPAKGKWFVALTDEAEEAILATKSWSVWGVMRSLVKRARTSHIAKEVSREEVAAEAGCSVKQVSRAYGVLAKLTVKDADGKTYPLIKKLAGGYQGHCSTFEVRGHRTGIEKAPRE